MLGLPWPSPAQLTLKPSEIEVAQKSSPRAGRRCGRNKEQGASSRRKKANTLANRKTSCRYSAVRGSARRGPHILIEPPCRTARPAKHTINHASEGRAAGGLPQSGPRRGAACAAQRGAAARQAQRPPRPRASQERRAKEPGGGRGPEGGWPRVTVQEGVGHPRAGALLRPRYCRLRRKQGGGSDR